ncbi:MAG: hypothetical protein ACJ8EG_03800 [Sphingomicrobium sp.]
MDVMAELQGIGGLVRASDFPTALERLWELWAEIPVPRTETPNAYLIIEYGVSCALKIGDFDQAQKWAALAPQFATVRHDMGEVEFLQGKVAFERGDHATARECFKVANAKSEGRAFEGEDERYRRLIA